MNNVRVMPCHEYAGYTVVVNALPAPGNRYYSVFSIHLPSPRTIPEQVALVYQQGNEAGVICETADEAHQDATERAHAWIDAAITDGYEIRAVNNTTSGDFLSFEMFVGNRWREVRISGTALAVLDKGARNARLDVFEQHLGAILRAAAPEALSAPDAPFVQLNDPF